VIIERPLGHAGLGRDGIDADRPDSLAVEQLGGRRDDAFARGVEVLGMEEKYTDQ
jgi:hypothetical protein